MKLHIFACTECKHTQKHVTSTPTPLGLAYTAECTSCEKLRTFEFIREGNRKEDWYANTYLQYNKQKSKNLSGKYRRKDDDLEQVAI